MPATSLRSLVRYCDQFLKTSQFGDWDGAFNGLQVENAGQITRLAAAVDASLVTIKLAIAQGADLLLVHHGLFWNAAHPWTGKRYEMIQLLIESNLAIYSSHLPLDAHPTIGNSIRLCTALGLKQPKPFFMTKGQLIGFKAKTNVSREDLRHRLARILEGSPVLLPGGTERCAHVGIVTGGAGSELRQAAEEGVDTFITGEGPHWTLGVAEELGINVFYGGHYATETFGVKALAEHLARKFKLPWSFIDHPSGL